MTRQSSDWRQENEMLSLSTIYYSNEFSYIKDSMIQCYYNIFPKVENGSLKLKTISTCNKIKTFKYFIKYLPPIKVYIQLPHDYPANNPPKFYVISSWLSSWQLSCICQKLDDIWSDNKGQEILFLWFEFLRNELLNFLHIKDTLDISLLYLMYHNISRYFNLNWSYQYDVRAVCNILFLEPLQFLINYDKQQRETIFKQNFFSCNICFDTYSGKECAELENCGHIFCRKCIEEYITVKMNDFIEHIIICPNFGCSKFISINDIKNLCSNLFSKYDKRLLQIALRNIENLIYCPRNKCQYAFIKDIDNESAICYNCGYCFCTYCYQCYHGEMLCPIGLKNKEKLIQEYESGDKYKKQLLVKTYGRKQIEKLVEQHLTNEYLKRCAKPCPKCRTMIEKIDGCNKMECTHCNTKFCWLCGIQITSLNPYEHYLLGNSTCHKRLFE
ncbi:E3 ubiquitin-protein ligase RNF14 [Megalopta genalis]|uniref:E3 ubiquitin-protein ligase RNF14 n=1 Tax=Megalopta genalis TaxID=115081 RepID=UPI003FD2BDDA